MFVFPQLPEGYIGVVHETNIIIEAREGGVLMWRKSVSYLRVQLVDLLDCQLNVSRVNGSSNVNPLLNGFQICSKLDVGLNRKLIRGSRVAIGDEVVHDQVIDVTEACY